MSKQEIEIVKKLSTSSSTPRPEFKEDLLKQLMALDKPEKERDSIMSKMKIMYALSFVMLALVGVGAYSLFSDEDEPKQNVVDNQELPVNDMSSSVASSLPSSTLDSFEDAEAAVDFTLYQPSAKLGDESIASIEKIDSFIGDGQDSIAIKYADQTGTLYRVNQSKFIGAPPEDAKNVSITFMGTKYTAKFAQILTLGEEDENSEAIAYGSDSTPASFLSWEANGIGYEISEFGRVSQAQLVLLAESMQ